MQQTLTTKMTPDRPHDFAQPIARKASRNSTHRMTMNDSSNVVLQVARGLMEVMPELVGVAQHDGKMLYLNPAGRRLLGLEPDEDITGVRIHEFYPDWSIGTLVRKGTVRVLANATSNRHAVLMTRDGRRVFVILTVNAHLSEESAIEYFSLVAHPVEEETSFQRRPVRISPLVTDTVDSLRASMPADITLKTRIDRDCGNVIADPTEIYQIVTNLCLNAFDAMRNRGGVLNIELDVVDVSAFAVDGWVGINSNRQVRLSVSDTGPGIEPSVAERIFESGQTTSAITDGYSSLGLAVVHGIVEQCGGAITVHNRPGQGVTFYVFLPKADG